MKVSNSKDILSSSKYRPEIDGLRAIAVIAVFFYHLNKELLPGGYWGVDMFFVISGYVVFLSTFLRDKKDSIISFYSRRIKRIVPGALCCVFFSILFSIVFLTPNSWTIKDASWSLLGFQNISLYLSSQNYFGVGLEDNIFLQFWSLGIEEQFYFIFPLIWYLFSKKKVRIFIFLAILLFASTYIYWAINSLLNLSSRSALFFLPQFRAWEILAGVLLAYFIHHKRGKMDFINVSNWFKSKYAFLIDFTFIFNIFLFFFYKNDNYSTKFIDTSIIVFLTIGILWYTYLNNKSLVFRLLKINPLIWIGRRSYGIYLYHWMVIVIFRNTFGDGNFIFYIGSIIFTFLFTILSWELLEKPLNKSRSSISYQNNLKVSSSRILILLSLFGSFSSQLIPRLLSYLPNYDYYNSILFSFLDIGNKTTGKQQTWELSAKKCHHKHSNLSDIVLTEKCFSLDTAESEFNRIYLIGDSHAQSLMPMVVKAINLNKITDKYVAKNVHIDSFNKILKGKTSYDFEYVYKNIKPNDIVLLNWYSGKFENLENKNQEFLLNYISKFINLITNNGGKIILIRDNPTLKIPIRIDRCIFQDKIGVTNSCLISKDNAIKKRSSQDRFWNKIFEQKSNKEVFIYDLSEDMCPDLICDYKDKKGNIVMVDFNHISFYESNKQGEKFSLLLEKVIFKISKKSNNY